MAECLSGLMFSAVCVFLPCAQCVLSYHACHDLHGAQERLEMVHF